MDRKILRTVWNSKPDYSTTNPRAIGGFRAIMNSGDWLSRRHAATGGAKQPQVASGNVKYVYDSSNYTRYVREKALNKARQEWQKKSPY